MITTARTPFLPLTLAFLGFGGAISALNYVSLGVKLPSATLLATTFALLPLSFLAWYFARLETFSPLRKMFTLAFLWGALGATGFALVANTFSVASLGKYVGVVIFAPAAEETLKGAFLLLLYLWRRPRFDSPLDGIIYAGFIGIGFAFVENITYFTAAYSGISVLDSTRQMGGFNELFVTVLLRGFATPFAHPLFTSMTGIGLGLAATLPTRRERFFSIAGGYAAALMLHALWNGLLTGESGWGLIGFYVFLFVPIFILYVTYTRREWQCERRELALVFQDLCRWHFLTAQEIPWLVTPARRRTARMLAGAMGKREGKRQMREFQNTALNFAELHRRYRAHTVADDFQQQGHALGEQLMQLRKTMPDLALLL